MSKTKWTNIKAMEPRIIAMHEASISGGTIAEEPGLELGQIEK